MESMEPMEPMEPYLHPPLPRTRDNMIVFEMTDRQQT